MKSYKFNCKPEDLDSGRIFAECSRAEMDWFVYPVLAYESDSRTKICISRRLLGMIPRKNRVELHGEILAPNWGFRHNDQYRFMSLTSDNIAAIAVEVGRSLDKAILTRYTVYHG